MPKQFFLALLVLTALACNALLPQSVPARISLTPMTIPQTADSVPRISVAEAKSALESGQAVMVDVRDAKFFARGHIAGAVNIPLQNIEIAPANLSLDKTQWIITYCA
jgi:3-mercaptopyruvate sulfurtransferase SseA